MSATIAYPPMSFITFTFPDDPFCGRVNDSSGATVYDLDLDVGLFGGKKSSSISRIGPRRSIDPVGSINWGGWTSSKNVTVGGINCGRLLDHRSTGFFSSGEYWFTAGDGREYYWKKKECFAASGQRVATYTRKKARLFHSNIPATLSVDRSYAAPAVLDFILISALLMEKKREDEERRRRRAAASGGGSGGGGGGGDGGGGGGC
ncbi:hypothetical protein M407DRAFT_244661 [Tulasnella calospora MUT 4182]|uniref:DUF6593 domain-containing protein n=1 Tax=Tulasnella calospora MUT 4182 TaxID=1051891 RepID=A0A0C3QDU3_9AGAM|nr:hypothetical protein M407DRAFT_244661 [Tulasnella calospora MUT 4182]